MDWGHHGDTTEGLEMDDVTWLSSSEGYCGVEQPGAGCEKCFKFTCKEGGEYLSGIIVYELKVFAVDLGGPLLCYNFEIRCCALVKKTDGNWERTGHQQRQFSQGGEGFLLASLDVRKKDAAPEPIASGSIKYIDGGPHQLFLKRLFVRDDFREHGIASQMLRILYEKARSINIFEVVIMPVENPAFFMHMGFETDSTTELHGSYKIPEHPEPVLQRASPATRPPPATLSVDGPETRESSSTPNTVSDASLELAMEAMSSAACEAETPNTLSDASSEPTMGGMSTPITSPACEAKTLMDDLDYANAYLSGEGEFPSHY